VGRRWHCGITSLFDFSSVRYLLLGTAVGGGASIARQYEDWKKGNMLSLLFLCLLL